MTQQQHRSRRASLKKYMHILTLILQLQKGEIYTSFSSIYYLRLQSFADGEWVLFSFVGAYF